LKRYLLILAVIALLLQLCACVSYIESPTEPTAMATQPIPETTQPPAIETDPPVVETLPPVVETVPPPQITYPIEEKEPPQIPLVWSANCEYYMPLYAYPDEGEIRAWIERGDEIELLDWSGTYAYVSYYGMRGYVMSCDIIPKEAAWVEDCLETVSVTAVYSYDQMLQDMEALARKYRGDVTLDIIGYSESGLKIPVMQLGDINATRHVLLQGAMHAREHMTAWLLMAMADCWLEQGLFSQEKVCFHIIPMTNPDGVQISQSGTLNALQLDIYQRDRDYGYTYWGEEYYAAEWKANGLGVDINRSFPSGWEETPMRPYPSSERYGGEAPFEAAEAIALRDYTLLYPFDITISYHSSGCIIYYDFGTQKWVNSASKELGLAANEITGYYLAGSGGVGGAGYKDWAIDEMQIPSLTIEIGCYDSPLAENEIYSTFARNLYILPMLMDRLT